MIKLPFQHLIFSVRGISSSAEHRFSQNSSPWSMHSTVAISCSRTSAMAPSLRYRTEKICMISQGEKNKQDTYNPIQLLHKPYTYFLHVIIGWHIQNCLSLTITLMLMIYDVYIERTQLKLFFSCWFDQLKCLNKDHYL